MPATRILLAPGASGSIERLNPHERGLTERGLSVRLLEIPRTRVERALPVYAAAVEEERDPVVIGGHSFGGRVASILASQRRVVALVCLSYPLHAPGRQEAWEERTSHWPRIAAPVLLLSGESDPFAEVSLLRQAVERLPHCTLVTYPGIGHGLTTVLDDALDRVASFVKAET